MSAGIDIAAEAQKAEHPRCWCCGKRRLETSMVRLCDHPEVGVCTSCVKYLRQQARHRH